MVTNEKGVTLVTYYADCTPLFFVDTKNKAIGLAHAGWRGTVGRIGEKVLKTMKENYVTNPQDVKVCIGPAISKCCYEVDSPVAEKFLELEGRDSSKFVFDKGEGKYMLDLLECNRQIVVSAGVNPENVVLSDLCKTVVLPLRLGYVGCILRKHTLKVVGEKLFNLDAGLMQHNGVELAYFRIKFNEVCHLDYSFRVEVQRPVTSVQDGNYQ